jgi:hypothetical protein
MKATQANATVVRIAKTPNGGPICNAEDLSLNNINLTFVGDPPTVISPKDDDNSAVEVTGSSTVVFRGLTFAHAAGAPAAGILVSSPNTTLSVVQCTIFDNDGYGIDGNNGGNITIDRSIIGDVSSGATNVSGGIRVADSFVITNSFIVNNGADSGGAAGAAGGIVVKSLNTTTPKQIINNTIAGNRSTGLGTGVSCPLGTNTTLFNNVLFHNQAQGVLSETDNCPMTYACTDEVIAGTGNVLISASPFVSAVDFHLAGVAPCRDVGNPTGAPPIDIDGDPRPNPITGKVDIGADQTQ